MYSYHVQFILYSDYEGGLDICILASNSGNAFLLALKHDEKAYSNNE